MEINKIVENTGKLFESNTKLDNSTKRDITRNFDKMTRNTYFREIPLNQIEKILRKYYIILLQEDYTEWSGWLTGSEGRTTFEVGDVNTKEGQFYTPYDNTKLILTWYQMSDNGRYEIVCYLS